MKQHSRISGFTLIELVVAMVIFGVLGTIGYELLQRSAALKEAISARSDALQEVQREQRILKDDFSQFINRGIRDERNRREAALILNGAAAGEAAPQGQAKKSAFLAEFTKTGWRNPLQARRSDLQRVAYALENRKLVRYYWPVLDRVQNDPQRQVLAEQIESAAINPLYGNADTTDPKTGITLPSGVEIVIDHALLGEIRQVVPIATYAPIKDDDSKTDDAPAQPAATGTTSGATTTSTTNGTDAKTQ